jgi:hypothetical protein
MALSMSYNCARTTSKGQEPAGLQTLEKDQEPVASLAAPNSVRGRGEERDMNSALPEVAGASWSPTAATGQREAMITSDGSRAVRAEKAKVSIPLDPLARTYAMANRWTPVYCVRVCMRDDDS